MLTGIFYFRGYLLWMKAFTTIPFFRIVIPFVIGILAAIKIEIIRIELFYFFLLFIPLIFFNFYKPAKPWYKRLFMISADLFLFLFGVLLVQQKDLIKQNDYYCNQVNTDTVITFTAIINDLPVEKEKFSKCDLKLLEIKKGKIFQKTGGTVYGYFKRSMARSDLKPGQIVLIKTNLLEVSPPKNPFEFDYKNYLYNKQIYHTAFMDSGAFAILPISSQLNPIWELGLKCKEFLLTRLKNSALNKNAYGICAALLTGYDDEIDKPVMEAFSHSGTLHVLSVSGLHTGLIYLALNFLFNFFDPKKKYKLSRFIFITLFLWFFALITGFSAPVLRAVLMFNLLGFGRIYFRARYKHQLNILLASAFMLLVYNPFYITDVGFLLSYFALFGLLYFQPKISAYWEPENKFVASIWQSAAASIAATISTLPITLFYFKQFPLWFFVCNVVVVPATFLLLILAVFVVFKINIIAILVNYVITGLIWFINLFNSKNFGFIDNIHFTFLDVFFLSLLIIILSTAFQYRSYKQFALSFILLITWQFFSLIDSYIVKNKSLLTVYSIKNESVVSVKNKTTVNLAEINSPVYNFNIKPHLNSFNYPNAKLTTFNVLKKNKQFVLYLNTPGYWPEIDLKEVTTLVLANNFNVTEQDLRDFQNLQTLVVDASNNNYMAARAEELCRNFNISFYNTKHSGAYLLAL